uniref:Aminoacylase 3 n=1 Tax=Monodelphis domestica TaxID=13616 RepID=A0A5F8HBW4_MONDO
MATFDYVLEGILVWGWIHLHGLWESVSRMCSAPSKGHPLSRVAITGGTHGNELSGVHLLKHWLQDPSGLHRRTFAATPVLANPKATEHCIRYINQDLNRSFTTAFLTSKDTQDSPYEVRRAQEINQLLGPKGSAEAFDFIFDLHNTTSNMAACLILNSEENIFAMHMCHYIQVPLLIHRTILGLQGLARDPGLDCLSGYPRKDKDLTEQQETSILSLLPSTNKPS